MTGLTYMPFFFTESGQCFTVELHCCVRFVKYSLFLTGNLLENSLWTEWGPQLVLFFIARLIFLLKNENKMKPELAQRKKHSLNSTNSFDRRPIELSWQCSRVGSQCGVTSLLLHCWHQAVGRDVSLQRNPDVKRRGWGLQVCSRRLELKWLVT